jgi:hypothetical protein
MNFLKICFVAIICLSLWLQDVASAATDPTGKALEIIYSDWTVKAKSSIVEKSFDKIAVARFIELLVDANNAGKTQKNNGIVEVLIRDLESPDVRDYSRELYEQGITKTWVGDFKWIDLNSDGVYDLLVSVDYSGRGFYNNLYIIMHNQDTYAYQEIRTENIERMDGSIEDLYKETYGSMQICFKGCKLIINDMDKDGYMELILPQRLTEYYGARPVAIWTAIYKLSGTKLQDASDQFKDFYKKVMLPKVDLDIRDTNKSEEAFRLKLLSGKHDYTEKDIKFYEEIYEEGLSANWIIRDKISRLIGEDPKAGLERAKKWMYSPNDNLRKNAIVVFGEIKDEESISQLQKLLLDSELSVAENAKSVLKKIREKKQ